MSRALLVLALLLAILLPASPTPMAPHRVEAASPAILSLDDRVACQTAIEQVYWQHRAWPETNPDPKPALSTVLPPAAIRAKVENSLRQSAALERFWGQPLTPTQLQAELDRMAARSQLPEVLAELFAALGDDPHRAAECLARPALADRLLRSWFAGDDRWQGEVQARAAAALATQPMVEQLPTLGGEYTVVVWVREEEGATTPASPDTERGPAEIRLNAEEWTDLVARLAAGLSPLPMPAPAAASLDQLPSPIVTDASALPVGVVGHLQEEPERLSVQAVLEQEPGRLQVATVSWAKASLDAWWAGTAPSLPLTVAEVGGSYVLPALAAACTDNTWPASPGLSSEVPDARYDHTAVWTGSEMIVWGGFKYGYQFNGGRYTPATDTWMPTNIRWNSVPDARSTHTAVWTGSEMLVWGGQNAGGYLNTGGRYSPSSNTWAPITLSDAPSARTQHTAVWTGSQMLIWGGYGGSFLNTGGRYSPSTDTWTPTSTTGAPSARSRHTAVWTGSEMLIWGGWQDFMIFNTGGRYSPSGNSWTPTNPNGAPSVRGLHSAVWTGSQMIVWGGWNGITYLNSGGRYSPGSNSWTSTNLNGAPMARGYHTAVWTGSEMIIWGGWDNYTHHILGGRYTPSSNSWATTSTNGAPIARSYHTAVWTGSQMIVWGGWNGVTLNSGGRYSPLTNAWTPTSTTGAPYVRDLHTAVWTGSEMLIWGGITGVGGVALNSGGRYLPATDTWTPTSLIGAPSARYWHTVVWTGSEMIVWGGWNGTTVFNSGGRYAPATNTWSPTATAGAPSVRVVHTAVWTGSQMLIWGGYGGGYLGTGGRYTPSSDSWTAITTAGAPDARNYHTAVWTGSEMIVFGGWAGGTLGTGGRYTPSSDSWTDTLTGGIRGARYDHTAVWTGTEMIVWGGSTGGYRNSGERYSPDSDTWTVITTSGAPSARGNHTAVWTGSQMIVWGGRDASNFLNTGGRYLPAADAWYATSITNAPSTRGYHTAVWTGSQMLVWGGYENSGPLATGGVYCAPGNRAWFFAEGYTGSGFDEYLTLQNPGTLPAQVSVTYLRTGLSPLAKAYTVPPTARSTLKVNDEVGSNQAVSMQVLSDRFIVAERPMYFAYGASGWTGGHDVVGAVSPSTTWYFAEGYTGTGFDEYLTLQNPNASPASVTLTYFLASGGPVTKSVSVPAQSRYTVAVHETSEGVGRGQAVSTKVSSSLPIVAERPMYFSYGSEGWTGGHVVVGATAPANTWYFAEGYTGAGFDEYLTLQNPNGSPASVTLTYYLASGGPVTKSVSVPANRRYTVAVHDTSEGVGRDQAVSVKVSSSLPIVTERPMYFKYGAGGWTGGHDVVGATAPKSTWYFAEGYTGAGFDEYLTVQNPNSSAATVTVTYYRGSGGPLVKSYPVGATRRLTVSVNGEVGPNQAVSMKVESTLPIVAERPMYFSYGPGWTGGHDVLGYAP